MVKKAVHKDLEKYCSQLAEDLQTCEKDRAELYERWQGADRAAESYKARLAEAERDAARYRWLRATGCGPDELTARCVLYEASIDDLDAAIDAAMGESRGNV